MPWRFSMPYEEVWDVVAGCSCTSIGHRFARPLLSAARQYRARPKTHVHRRSDGECHFLSSWCSREVEKEAIKQLQRLITASIRLDGMILTLNLEYLRGGGCIEVYINGGGRGSYSTLRDSF
ncbi:unnamed protein product [Amoebophrya sp. A120]|nr:unnamed protein product [Amoebophrya sp. A120]|eukprot:GSA120T00020616001.1